MSSPRTVCIYGTLLDVSGNPVIGVSVSAQIAGATGTVEYENAADMSDPSNGDDILLSATVSTLTAAAGPISAPTLSGSTAGTNIPAGTYKWSYTDVFTDGSESAGSPLLTSTIVESDHVSLAGIAAGGTTVVARKVYRTGASGSTLYLLGTIADNTTTTFTDNYATSAIINNPTILNEGGWHLFVIAPGDLSTANLYYKINLNGVSIITTSFDYSSSPVLLDTLYASSPPSSTTVAAMTGYVLTASGVPAPGITVTAYLSTSAIYTGTGETISSGVAIQTTTDNNGFYSLNLIPSSLLTPTTSYYTITEGNSGSAKTIQVPVDGGAVNSNIVTPSPPSGGYVNYASPTAFGITKLSTDMAGAPIAVANSEKNNPYGVPTLDSQGHVKSTELYAIAPSSLVGGTVPGLFLTTQETYTQLSNPVTTPSLALASGPSTLPIATLYVGYSWRNGLGPTQISSLASIAVTSSPKQIAVTLPSRPSGATTTDVFVSVSATAGSSQLGYVGTTTSTSFSVTALPSSTAPGPSTTNVAGQTSVVASPTISPTLGSGTTYGLDIEATSAGSTYSVVKLNVAEGSPTETTSKLAVQVSLNGTDVLDIDTYGQLTSQSAVIGSNIAASGLTGATAASRYAGATSSGAPGSGTFAVGDYVVDRSGALHICTVAGSPGTWVSVGAGGANAQAGTQSITIMSGDNSAAATITFPSAFGAAPVIVVSTGNTVIGSGTNAMVDSVTSTDFSAIVFTDDGAGTGSDVPVPLYWIAMPAS